MNELELFKATEAGDVSAVEALLATGAQVNDANPGGETALMRAASKGHLDVVRLLLKAGADANARRADGMTPLIYAAFFGHADVVRLLIDVGADSDARDRLGMTALEWARSKGATETVNILRGAAAPEGAPRHEAGREVGSEEVLDLPEVDSVAGTDALADGTLDLPAPPGLRAHARHAQPLQLSANPPAAEPAESSQTGGADRGVIEYFDTPASASAVTSNEEILDLPEAGYATTPDDLAEGMLDLSGGRRLTPVARRAPSDEIPHPGPPPSPNPGTETEDGVEYDTPQGAYPQTPITWFRYACLSLSIVIITATLTFVIFRDYGLQPVNPEAAAQPPPAPGEVPQAPPKPDDDAALTAALNGWLEATRARDLEKQMSFYAPSLRAYYRKRYVPSSAVRADKEELFGRARRVEISAGEPEIRFGKNSPTASMRFRKGYTIESGAGSRSGEVIQELIWRKTKDGWKIISERDVTIVR